MAQQVQNKLSLDVRRAALLNDSYPRIQEVPVIQFQSGETVEVRLPHSGVGLGCYITAVLTVDAAAGAVGTASTLGLGTLIKNIKLRDASGVVRHSLSGAMLEKFGRISKFAYDEAASTDTEVYDFAAPAAEGSETWKLQLFLPFSINDYSTIGAIPLAIPTSDTVLTIEFQAIAGSTIYFPITTADATKYSIDGTYGKLYITVKTLEPRQSIQLPTEDFNVYHELLEITDFSNLTSGAQKRTALQTGRTVQRVMGYLTQGAASEALTELVDYVGFIMNGATPITRYNYETYTGIMNKKYGKRLTAGFFMWDFADHPFSPQNYGELATELQLAATFDGTKSRLVLMTESLYQVAASAV